MRKAVENKPGLTVMLDPRVVEKDATFIRMATELGKLGTCDRAHVGAIITKDGRAISWGYNGAIAGQPHCDINNHGHGGEILDIEKCGCDMGVTCRKHQILNKKLREQGCINVTHAEANAICFAARQGISTEGCTIYAELSPCLQCARLIISAGIIRCVFRFPYRIEEGTDLLGHAGVRVSCVPGASRAS